MAEIDDMPVNSHVYFRVPTAEMEEKVEGDVIHVERSSKKEISLVSMNSEVPSSKSESEPINDEDTKSVNVIDIDPITTIESSPPPASTTNIVIKLSRIEKVKLFVIEYYLPLGFACALIFALSYPYPGKTLASYTLYGFNIAQAINNFLVFFISGISLNTKAVFQALQQYKALALGLFAILVLTPCFSFGIVRIPYQPIEFAIGLSIFNSVPTTLGVGVALTTACDGTVPIALFLTLVTNLVGIVVVPYFLNWILIGSTVVTFDPTKVFVQLIFTIFIPSLLGFLLRQVSAIEVWVNKHKKALSMFSSSNLICIMWQVLSSAASILLAQSIGNIFIMIVSTACLHIMTLSLMMVLTSKYIFPLHVKDRVAVVIMSSQKSAPVAVAVISYITNDTATQGLLCLPALIGQMGQIFIGYILVSRFRALIRHNTDTS